jgi:acyl-CoA dehydrogenase
MLADRLAAVLPASPSDLDRRPALLAAVAALPLADGSPLAIVASLGQSGLLAECIPRPFGGSDDVVSVRAICLVRAALAYRSPLADLMFAMQGLGSHAVASAGSPAQQAALLPAIASGQAIGAIALTEAEAGSDLTAIRTRAVRQSDGSYRIDGEKLYISNAGLASHYVLYARTAEQPKQGLTAFLLPAMAPGLAVEPLRLLCDDHPIGKLKLTAVHLPATARIGAEGQGLALALATLERFRPSVGAAAVGMAQRALDEAIDHVRRRQQFGQPLASFQATQLAIAEMAIDCTAAALLVQHAAYQLDQSRAAPGPSAMAKLAATEMAQRVVDRALQLHGGSGLIAGSPIERLYRDVRALRIYEGTSEIQKLIIARHLLKT